MLYAEFVVLFVILLPNTRAFYRYSHTVIFQTFTIFAFMSHLRAMFTDPVRISYNLEIWFSNVCFLIDSSAKFYILYDTFLRSTEYKTSRLIKKHSYRCFLALSLLDDEIIFQFTRELYQKVTHQASLTYPKECEMVSLYSNVQSVVVLNRNELIIVLYAKGELRG